MSASEHDAAAHLARIRAYVRLTAVRQGNGGAPMTTVIHTPVPAEHHDLALRLLAAQDDDESRCGSCLMPVEPAELVDVHGGTCLNCVRAMYGDDVYGPCHERDL